MKTVLSIHPLRTLPLIREGDNVAELLVKAARREKIGIRDNDIIVVAQKIVSKSEGRILRLKDVQPSAFAIRIGKITGRDPRHVEVILRETKRIVRMKSQHIITETRHGLVCANAGVDKSNVEDEDAVSLLPINPDASARRIRNGIKQISGKNVAVIVADTFGRPWRLGHVNLAIGLAGIEPIRDYRGEKDMFDYTLTVSMMAVADEVASAAELVMEKSARIPVALIRGYKFRKAESSARALVRPSEIDLFR